MKLWKSLIVACSMYSRIPMPQIEWDEDSMKYAMCFFPFVGVCAGILEILAGWILREHTTLGNLFTAVVLALIPVLLTGGIHLDGFADTTDALSSYGDREKKLAILKDSHAGAFAVIGLSCYILAWMGLWTEVRGQALLLCAWIFPFSRSLSGLSVVTFQAAKDSGLLRMFQDGAHRRNVKVVLWGWSVICLSGMAVTAYGIQETSDVGWAVLRTVIVAGAGVLMFLYYKRTAYRQFGGTTGDLAGWFLQLGELAMLAAVVFTTPGIWR